MRSVAELVAMLMIGDMVVASVAARRNNLSWRLEPEGYRQALGGFATSPTSSPAEPGSVWSNRLSRHPAPGDEDTNVGDLT